MKKNVTINKKTYQVKEIGFNSVCELEDVGLSLIKLQNFNDRPFSVYRACFAFHSGLSLEEAGNEMGEHLIGGGSLEDFKPFFEAIGEGDFFIRLMESQAKK